MFGTVMTLLPVPVLGGFGATLTALQLLVRLVLLHTFGSVMILLLVLLLAGIGVQLVIIACPVLVLVQVAAVLGVLLQIIRRAQLLLLVVEPAVTGAQAAIIVIPAQALVQVEGEAPRVALPTAALALLRQHA